MPQSLKARFNGNTQEAIDYVRIWGRQKGFDYYYKKGIVKDWLAWVNFLKDETHDPNFGLFPTLGGTGNNNWAEDLLDAFENKVDRMKAREQQLIDKIHQIEGQLDYYKTQQALQVEPRIQQIMAKCKV